MLAEALDVTVRLRCDVVILDEAQWMKNWSTKTAQAVMLLRMKSDVEEELPDRTDRTFFVPLSGTQSGSYEAHAKQVAILLQIAKRRPLTEQESDKLLRELSMMRMVCDTNYILDSNDKV